jgi:hypothetical protein
MMYEHGELWWNDTDREELKNLKENLSQYHFIHHKSFMD